MCVCVCVCVGDKVQTKKRKKKKMMIKYGKAERRCRHRPISTCHSRLFQSNLTVDMLFVFVLEKKKKEEMACPVVSCHFILKHCEPRGLFIYHPPKISTHFNSQIQSQPKTVYGNVDVVDVFDLHQWEKVATFSPANANISEQFYGELIFVRHLLEGQLGRFINHCPV